MASDNSDDDPVIAEYPVFLNPQTQYQLHLLQFPERGKGQGYNEANGSLPRELRIKPQTGQIEVDVPIPTNANYDQRKGRMWAEALAKSKVIASGGSHGLAGGFGIGLESRSKRRDDNSEDDEDNEDEDENDMGHNERMAQWDDETKPMLDKLTIGGQIIRAKAGNPIYAIGTFRLNPETSKREFHLTPLSGIATLSPQLHHIDALAEGERLMRPTGGANEAGAEARAVNVTLARPSDKGKGRTAETEVTRTLKAVQEEKWEYFRWVDTEHPDTWGKYFETMFAPNSNEANVLKANMTKEEWLDAFSAPRMDPTRRGEKPNMRRRGEYSDDDDEDDDTL
ncbi:MAG: hypothetical protein M1834_005863 [Cirrosporium novae-zelandiae]|nr:MAG: hypothetical protein M1834_005863 [Cirrosporium novae-zelandiae]